MDSLYPPKKANLNNNTRLYDSNDNDFYDLMMISNYEPNIAQCMHIIYATCLSEDITISVNNRQVTNDFHAFVQRTYVPFLKSCIKSMYICGFAAWHLTYNSDGDIVPENIPIGSFTWSTETKEAYYKKKQRDDGVNTGKVQRQKFQFQPPEHVQAGKISKCSDKRYIRQRKHLHEQFQKFVYDERINSNLTYYQIKFIRELGVKAEDVEIFNLHTPSLCGDFSSSVQSPLLHVLQDYKRCRETLSTLAYADIWNLQARMVCSYQPAQSDKYSVNEGNPIISDRIMPQNRSGGFSDDFIPSEMNTNMFMRDRIMEKMISCKDTGHKPNVYTLPKNTSLESTPKLESCMNMTDLQLQMRSNISKLMGIPLELLEGFAHSIFCKCR